MTPWTWTSGRSGSCRDRSSKSWDRRASSWPASKHWRDRRSPTPSWPPAFRTQRARRSSDRPVGWDVEGEVGQRQFAVAELAVRQVPDCCSAGDPRPAVDDGPALHRRAPERADRTARQVGVAVLAAKVPRAAVVVQEYLGADGATAVRNRDPEAALA